MFAQVYGGATSIMIGSYSWSFSGSPSKIASIARSGDSYCSGCVASMSDVAVTNSIAVSNGTGKLCAAFHTSCQSYVFTVPACFHFPDLTRFPFPEPPYVSYGSNVSVL